MESLFSSAFANQSQLHCKTLQPCIPLSGAKKVLSDRVGRGIQDVKSPAIGRPFSAFTVCVSHSLAENFCASECEMQTVKAENGWLRETMSCSQMYQIKICPCCVLSIQSIHLSYYISQWMFAHTHNLPMVVPASRGKYPLICTF